MKTRTWKWAAAITVITTACASQQNRVANDEVSSPMSAQDVDAIDPSGKELDAGVTIVTPDSELD